MSGKDVLFNDAEVVLHVFHFVLDCAVEFLEHIEEHVSRMVA